MRTVTGKLLSKFALDKSLLLNKEEKCLQVKFKSFLLFNKAEKWLHVKCKASLRFKQDGEIVTGSR